MKASPEEWDTLPEESRLRAEKTGWKHWKLSRTITPGVNDVKLLPGEEMLSIKATNNSQLPYYLYGVNATPDACIVSFLPSSGTTEEIKPKETKDFSTSYALIFEKPREYVRILASAVPIVHCLKQPAFDAEEAREEKVIEDILTRGQAVSSLPYLDLTDEILKELISRGNFFADVRPSPLT
jgi:hypothetical protein